MPPLGAVRSTVTVQELWTAIAPPVKVTVEPPAAAVLVPPMQVVPALGVLATTKPLGNVSMSGAVRLVAVASALPKVMVRVDIPFLLMVAGLKALPSVGGTTPAGGVTVKVATAGAAFLPLLVDKTPPANELM